MRGGGARKVLLLSIWAQDDRRLLAGQLALADFATGEQRRADAKSAANEHVLSPV
jgi:hypothetical protein